MTVDESVDGMHLRVIEHAQVLGNISAVCREFGISGTLFYRWRRRLEQYEPDGVHPRRQQAQLGRPVATPSEVERLVLGIAISAATCGCRRIAAYLMRTWDLRLAPSTVQPVLRLVGLATPPARLTELQQQAPRTAGLLTERTREQLWRARHGHASHIEATDPGQLVCLDTFYIGNLKGVSKVWQITACDAATSYGLAGLLPTHDAAAAETLPGEVVVPPFQRAGWSVRRVLTDGSPEFKSAFDLVCRQLGVRHTTKPRHAWTNAFVERLQGTILEELGRMAFRRRYFTTRAALHRALAGFMRYYNTERTHQRYRLLGRTPAALILGVATP
jgi:transposase InsO family protein